MALRCSAVPIWLVQRHFSLSIVIVETAYLDFCGTGEFAVWSLEGLASPRLVRGSFALRSSGLSSLRDLYLPNLTPPVTLTPNATISKVLFHLSSV